MRNDVDLNLLQSMFSCKSVSEVTVRILFCDFQVHSCFNFSD